MRFPPKICPDVMYSSLSPTQLTPSDMSITNKCCTKKIENQCSPHAATFLICFPLIFGCLLASLPTVAGSYPSR